MLTATATTASASAENDVNEDKSAIEKEMAVYDQTVSAGTVC